MRTFFISTALVLGVAFGGATTVHADDEPWLLTIDADAAQPLSQPHRHEFGLGLGLGAGVYRAFTHRLLAGARFRAVLQLDDDPPENPRLVDKGPATASSTDSGPVT